jgi:hypothetical protein
MLTRVPLASLKLQHGTEGRHAEEQNASIIDALGGLALFSMSANNQTRIWDVESQLKKWPNLGCIQAV